MDKNKTIRWLIFITSLIGTVIIVFDIGNIKNPENFRLIGDIIQNILLFNLIIVVFVPSNKLIKISLIIGIFTMVFDFILEAIAEYLNWWYPEGVNEILGVPIEMVLSFFLIGASMSIVFTFPEKVRKTDFKIINWTKPLFKNEKYDIFWRILLLIGNAVIGTNGDYSAGIEIWRPGPSWLPIYTFIVWLGGGFIILLIFTYLEKKFIKNKLRDEKI